MRKTFKNWWVHYFLRYGERILHTRSCDKFYVRYHTTDSRIADLFVILETYFDGTYTKEFDVGKKDIVVDIGVYIGDFTVYAAKKAINGKVYAFEPFPESFKQLNKNLSINNLKNVYAYKEGVSGKTGVKQLYLKNHLSHTTTPEVVSKNGYNGVIEIKVTTMDNIFKRFGLKKIDFLKIEKIAMELHKCSNYTFKDMIDFPNEVGYKVSWNVDISEDLDNVIVYAQRK